jgi:hypothetical protein
MTVPFTVDQFYGVFRGYNTAVWPAQWRLVALAVTAPVRVARPQCGLNVAATTNRIAH